MKVNGKNPGLNEIDNKLIMFDIKTFGDKKYKFKE